MTNESDLFDLGRFVDAQDDDGVYEDALAEIRAGRKRSHWMWFIFPQFAGLGQSSTSKFFAIRSAAEARAYRAHPLLGPRLLECTNALLGVQGRSVGSIFGTPDDLKLRSSMTLFEATSPGDPAFAQVLERYFNGQRDETTLRLLRNAKG